jgi:hypothetical protein
MPVSVAEQEAKANGYTPLQGFPPVAIVETVFSVTVAVVPIARDL